MRDIPYDLASGTGKSVKTLVGVTKGKTTIIQAHIDHQVRAERFKKSHHNLIALLESGKLKIHKTTANEYRK